ncbi:MAG: phosphopyruvate hydratase [Planctomycetaceae bacterium]
MPKIVQIHAREIFDSRGRPTVEAEVCCEGGGTVRAIAPSGASTGSAEAWELRDGGSRLKGLGVRRAVENITSLIRPALLGHDAADQRAIDQRLCELDGTPNKSRLGANAILATSLATAYAAADALQKSPVEHFTSLWRQSPSTGRLPTILGSAPALPLPMVNMISGGLHAGGNLDFQDFLIIPVGASRFSEALDWIVEIYVRLGKLLTKHGFEGVLVGDEGGYGPKLETPQQALELILEAVELSGLQPGAQVGLALDVASSHFYADGKYRLKSGKQSATLTSEGMIDLLAQLVESYPILSIEDGLAEEDWSGWEQLTRRLGAKVQLIGDDLFATNPHRLQRGIAQHAANSVLIKLNQIGTLSETFETIRLALDHGYRPVISARSGETEDVTIADLAVATGAGQIKIGSVARSERLVKYNQLLRWEERLGASAPFVGNTPFSECAP